MSGPTFSVLLERRFAAFFATQFLGALNDNVFRNAIVTMIAFGAWAQAPDGDGKGLLLHLAIGLFMLPFFLFSATAGTIADLHEKRRLIIGIKGAEIVLMLLAGVGFGTGNVHLLLVTLFLMGAQSTFFGPIKYSYLPEILPKDSELVTGNGCVSASTYLSILIGIIVGTHLGGSASSPEGTSATVLATVVGIAVAGLLAALLIPRRARHDAPARDAAAHAPWNIVAQTRRIVRMAAGNPRAMNAILGISWFWLVGALFLTQLPLLVETVGYPVPVYQALLMLVCVGVAVGALLVSALAARHGTGIVRHTSMGALLAVAAALLHLSFVPGFEGPPDGSAGTLGEFLGEGLPAYWTLLDIVVISVAEGILVVPLITQMQKSVTQADRSSIVAANNIVNALFIVAASLAAGALLQTVLGFFQLYAVLAALTVAFCLLLNRRFKHEHD